MRTLFTLAMLLISAICGAGPGKYNIIWDKPGNSSHSSMPLGNGDIGLNLWTEDNGSISFYISKTDAWEENGRLLKIGKIKLTISPNPFTGNNFRQKLNLEDGTIEIEALSPEKHRFVIWADANNPVVHVDAYVPEKTMITVTNAIWRTKADTAKNLEASDLHRYPEIYGPTVTSPDVVMNLKNRIAWYHYNPETRGFKINLQLQGLDAFGITDPLKDRIFGALAEGTGFRKKDNLTLTSKSGTERHLSISVLTAHPSTPEQWYASISKIALDASTSVGDTRFTKHRDWWKEYWNRSWIEVSSDDTITTQLGLEKQGDVLTRGYALQRFINACGARGVHPVKFNGSIFTVDYKDGEGFGDYRRWGTGYWWQNTRLPYISMPASGDQEMMQPLFRMYFSQLQLAKSRTKLAFGHDGAYFPECIYFWGPVFSQVWGKNNIDQTEGRIQESGWHKYEWVCGPELASMMYDYYLYTGDRGFAKEILLPFAEQVLLFFDQHYKPDEKGKLRFEPSQALETWWKCTNAAPEVAGMHYLAGRINSMPADLVPASLKTLASNLAAKLPPVPLRQLNGRNMLAPASVFDVHNNIETPELYPVYPFKLYGLGKPGLIMAVAAYENRNPKGFNGWRQDDIFAAQLGLVDEAKKGILKRASSWDKTQKFPAFWGPNYDWTPDQCHGGVLMKTLQVMLLQCDEKEIRILPSWPEEWDVSFKLKAPYNTTVECTYKDGKIVNLNVTPESRMKDVIMPIKLRTMKYTSRPASQAAAWQKELRSQFYTLLKMDRMMEDRKNIPFNVKEISSEKKNGYVQKELEINTTASRRMRIILTLPLKTKGPVPAVVSIHGHGGQLGSVYDTGSIYKGFATELSASGFVTIATTVSQHNIYEDGRMLMGERLWDLIRCVDFLETLKEVDKTRIGCAGLSLGGEMAMWLGAMDERIKATLSSGYLTVMDQMEQNHCMCWKFPGLRELADWADVYSLIAPRSLMCQNGMKEPVNDFTIPLAKKALSEIEVIYNDYGKKTGVTLVAHPGAHEIDLPSLMEFFRTEL